MTEMTIDEFHTKINESLNLGEQIVEAESIFKELKKAKFNLDSEVEEFNREYMPGIKEHKGKKLTIKLKSKIRVVDSNSNHAKKVEFYKRLDDAGYDEYITYSEDANIDGRKFDKKMEGIPSEILTQAEIDKLIYIELIPIIKVEPRK